MGEKCILETTSVSILLLHVETVRVYLVRIAVLVVCDQPVAASAQPAKIR